MVFDLYTESGDTARSVPEDGHSTLVTIHSVKYGRGGYVSVHATVYSRPYPISRDGRVLSPSGSSRPRPFVRRLLNGVLIVDSSKRYVRSWGVPTGRTD